MIQLHLRYSAESEWHGKLVAEVESGEFRGSGSAWFTLEELRKFLHLVSDYPIVEGQEPTLAGGFWDERGETLEECHLGIRFSPDGSKGSVRATVNLVAPPSHDETLPGHKLTTNFRVNHGDVQRFVTEFALLLDGKSAQAELKSTRS
ncbi:hypothetical protein [Novosphingobium aquimarinum]|uniref:hypothetical protein n=1 Tax=Novosphingobium aquimarinum TaxID=2682494 RepID=UPI0012EBAEC9|nr:hypothetical protein [Novosphingobium aquimarinum]